jgi:hypothetical protein
MKEKCPYIDNCPMFSYFTSNFAKAQYKLAFCFDDYFNCVRKIKRDRGEIPPDKLLPDGRWL